MSGDKKVEVFGSSVVPTDHTMVDMSILLRGKRWTRRGSRWRTPARVFANGFLL